MGVKLPRRISERIGRTNHFFFKYKRADHPMKRCSNLMICNYVNAAKLRRNGQTRPVFERNREG